jgi:hypothetical protein
MTTENKTNEFKCCGEEIATPYCPHCGKEFEVNDPLALLRHICDRALAARKSFEKATAAVAGSSAEIMWKKWESYVKAITGLYAVNMESDWEQSVDINFGPVIERIAAGKEKNPIFVEAVKRIRSVDICENEDAAGNKRDKSGAK